jgi:type IV pilus assembly protein PilA
MTTLNSRLQLALLNRKKGRNLLEKGFTLVELMIVIVIVGILSAVALPNFLSQTSKAKATEVKTLATAALKEAQVAWTETGATGLTDWAKAPAAGGQCPANTTNFEFTCDGSTNTAVTVTGTGTAASGDLSTKTVIGTLNVTTGGQVAFTGTAL